MNLAKTKDPFKDLRNVQNIQINNITMELAEENIELGQLIKQSILPEIYNRIKLESKHSGEI